MTELTDKSEAATPGAASIHERLRSLAQRPKSLTVHDVIDDYMAQYAGRDVTRGQRLRAWQSMIGEFTLEQCDSDLMHVGRSELATKPALVYKGKDHRGIKVFDLKSRRKPKDPATLKRSLLDQSPGAHRRIDELRAGHRCRAQAYCLDDRQDLQRREAR